MEKVKCYVYTDSYEKVDKDRDCTECKSFYTAPIIFPTGKCNNDKVEDKFCGLCETCDLFEGR